MRLSVEKSETYDITLEGVDGYTLRGLWYCITHTLDMHKENVVGHSSITNLEIIADKINRIAKGVEL